MPRWITIRTPFDYHWPDRSALTYYKEPGDEFVKDEIADFAVARGYATEGKADASARSRKGGPKRVRRKGSVAKAANPERGLSMGDEDVPADDRSADRAAMDHDAG